jgi:hypothetical protein
MFGTEYRWNVEGDELYRTGLGACCSVLLVVIVLIFAAYVFKQAILGPPVKMINEFTLNNHFTEDTIVTQTNDKFYFAVGVSTFRNFTSGQGANDTLNSGLTFTMNYQITGGPDDGKYFNIGFRPCVPSDWDTLFAYDPTNKDVISAHVNAN